jgi:hypothetical protein
MANGTRKIVAPERPPRQRPALKSAIIKQEKKKDPKGLGAKSLAKRALIKQGARSLAEGAGKSFKRMPVASPHSIQGKRLSKRRK